MSDKFVEDVYKATRKFPREETYGITSQLRRAAVSVPTNIVEGCARESTKEYLNFLRISYSSLKESGYLIDLSHRLGYLGKNEHESLTDQFENLSRTMNALLASIKKFSRAKHKNA